MRTTHLKTLILGLIIPLLLHNCKKDPLIRPSVNMESVLAGVNSL